MAISQVVVDDRLHLLNRDIQRAVERAMGTAAAATVSAVRAEPTDYNLRSITSKAKATPVHRVSKGWRSFVYVDDFRMNFFERGTYNRRRGKLSPKYHRTAKAEAIAAQKGTGVKAQHVLGHAARVANAALVREVRRQLGRL
jgi:hypothetical protein